MKIKLKDIQQSSMEKKRQIDEMNELHEEYKVNLFRDSCLFLVALEIKIFCIALTKIF